jgi:hypothetical protein
MIVGQNGLGLVAEDVADDTDSAILKALYPVRHLRAFVKSNFTCIFITCTAHKSPDARPDHGAQTHGARLGAADKLTGWQAFGAKVIGSERFLSEGHCHNLSVSGRAVGADYQVNTGRNQSAAAAFKDRGCKRAACLVLDV